MGEHPLPAAIRDATPIISESIQDVIDYVNKEPSREGMKVEREMVITFQKRNKITLPINIFSLFLLFYLF